jgi:hypothetical protein
MNVAFETIIESVFSDGKVLFFLEKSDKKIDCLKMVGCGGSVARFEDAALPEKIRQRLYCAIHKCGSFDTQAHILTRFRQGALLAVPLYAEGPTMVVAGYYKRMYRQEDGIGEGNVIHVDF